MTTATRACFHMAQGLAPERPPSNSPQWARGGNLDRAASEGAETGMRSRIPLLFGSSHRPLAPAVVSASWLALLLTLGGCGGSTTPAETAAVEAPVVEAPAEPPQPRRAGTITRAELFPVLEGGLGRFLGGVGTEPQVEAGRFVGWRITRFFPEDPRFADIALRPGDVVTRVNAQPIERPEQAFRVWDGLRVASELVVDFTHEGQPQQMRYAIED